MIYDITATQWLIMITQTLFSNDAATENHIFIYCTVDPVTNDLASARQKNLLVTESRWSQE